jgi:hypothetical protein
MEPPEAPRGDIASVGWTTRSASRWFIGDYPAELVGNAQPVLRLGEPHYPAVGGNPAAIEGGRDRLASHSW